MEFINDLNLKKQADDLGIKVWQTPSFLFIVLGFINILAMTVTYFIARNYDNPEMLVLSESIVTVIILFIGNIIVNGVEQIAKLNKSKSEFIAIVSHQLRTPLSAVQWEIELMNSKFCEGLSIRQAKSIANIEVLTRRMNKMVNDLLSVAQIDQKKMIFKKEKVDLTEVAEEVKADLEASLKLHEIVLKIKTKNPEKKTLVIGDREKIRLVMENLLSNSIKYSRKHGKIEILIKGNHAFWVFSIKDNGIGIPRNQHEQVFSKFFRSYNTARYQAEGTGLGLYIVKNIIEKLGGRVWFKSEENIGSIFNFSLPMA